MSAPVKHTCPDIDKALKLINAAIKDAEYGMKGIDKSSSEYDSFRDIINSIEDVPAILEDLRASNDTLRQWGEHLTNELEVAVATINDLENELGERLIKTV